MVEVTRTNFPDVLAELEKRINQSSFVSFDCEFSKLPEYSEERSFFVDINDRYKEFLNTIQDTVALQVGLALFKYNRDLNQYDASVYKFHVCPSFCGRLFNPPITFVGGSVSFLCQTKFDFNKAFYEGVHCLNRSQERLVRTEVCQDSFLAQSWVKMSLEENDVASEFLDEIRLIENGPCDIQFTGNDSPFFRFVLRRLIRKNYPQLEIVDGFEEKKITVENRQIGQPVSDNDVEILIDELKGFSKVYDMLIKAKKPLVGHNLFSDLLVMYNQFYDSLPVNYSTFKSSVHSLFPSVYDTKLISRELKINDKNIRNKSLKELYYHLKKVTTDIKDPKVVLANDYKTGNEHFHDAGWDAFATGFCFIRLGSVGLETNSLEGLLHTATFSESLKCMERYKNKINVVNANIPLICLGGVDPISRRPPYLHVKFKRNATQSLDEFQGSRERTVIQYQLQSRTLFHREAQSTIPDLFIDRSPHLIGGNDLDEIEELMSPPFLTASSRQYEDANVEFKNELFYKI